MRGWISSNLKIETPGPLGPAFWFIIDRDEQVFRIGWDENPTGRVS